MTTVHAIRSSRIVTPAGIQPGVVVILDGKILAIAPSTQPFVEVPVFDVGDHMVLPGLIDIHSQLNEPGANEWEAFETGTKAAAAAGFTTVVDVPSRAGRHATELEALADKRAAVFGKASVDYAFWAGVIPQDATEVAGLAKAGVKGFKCLFIPPDPGETGVVERGELLELMSAIGKTGLPLLAHTEIVETEVIPALIDLVSQSHCRVHIVHLSAAAALESLEAARLKGQPLTAETCPHYLYFSSDKGQVGLLRRRCGSKVHEAVNQARLWEALRSGGIDIIASDHFPEASEIDSGRALDFRAALGSIISLSVSLPAMWTSARERGFHITDLVRWMAHSPAALAGLQTVKGRISPGWDADLVVFDPDSTFEVAADVAESQNYISPYVGEKLEGRVVATLVRGEIVYEEGRFRAGPVGREVH